MKQLALLRLFFLLLFAFIIFLFVNQSFASPLQPWPAEIRYLNKTENPQIDQAARDWQLAGLPRFVAVSRAEEADVVVVEKSMAEMQSRCENDCLGYATGLGYSPDGREVALAKGMPKEISYIVALHEFGHILGLEHETTPGCYLMSTVIRPGCGTGLSPNAQYRLQALYPDFSS